MINKKIKFYVIFILVLGLIVMGVTLINECFGAGTPKLVSTMEKELSNIEAWLIKLATPMAAVAVGSGLFMQKFSFGDEEKIRTGKKLVKTSLFSYAFILAIDLVLSAIQSLI